MIRCMLSITTVPNKRLPRTQATSSVNGGGESMIEIKCLCLAALVKPASLSPYR
jgi:hypothetical protein